MEPNLQRRVQRYGWDKAAGFYETGWRAQLEPAQSKMLEIAEIEPGERVLDVACGTGLVSFRAAEATGSEGHVLGTDISGEMIEVARQRAEDQGMAWVRFERADAENMILSGEEPFDVALCALGLMYVPDPVRALREIARHLKVAGRCAVAVWGARAKCGWADVFPITDARVASDVCPLFFRLGTADSLDRAYEEAGYSSIESVRLDVMLHYESEEEALGAAFRGGPVALAYSRFDEAVKQAVHEEYLASISTFRDGEGYRIPGEFVVTCAVKS